MTERNPRSSSQAIGMFDSGVGGLTVMRQMQHFLPQEKVVYFADTARIPYGDKSQETVLRYSIENAIFLMDHQIKMLVIACNTASAFAGDKLKQIFNIPVVDVIEPGAEKAAQVTQNQRIGVLGTKGTIHSGVHKREILRRLPNATIFSIACPLWVPIVEERFTSHPSAKLIVKEYLSPLLHQQIDTLLLGCTHYPLLRHLIEEEIGDKVTIVDPAVTCVEKVTKLLSEKQLCAPSNSKEPHRYFVSDDPEKFRILGQEFLGGPLPHVEAASAHTR